MADEKKAIGRYFYLMLKENHFDSDDMIILESMDNGYLYSNILLKLYLKSLKDKGKLMYKNRIPYNPAMLAKITRHNIDVVSAAIKIFENMGIIEVLDNGAMFMLDIENYIGKSSTEADRRRKYDRRISEEKQQLRLSEKSCENSHEHIESESNLELEDGLIDINNIYTQLDEIELVQMGTEDYNKIFIDKGIYIVDYDPLPTYLYRQLTLFQKVVSELVESKQLVILEKVTFELLEKVWGQVIKAKVVNDIVNYYKAALLNEISKKR